MLPQIKYPKKWFDKMAFPLIKTHEKNTANIRTIIRLYPIGAKHQQVLSFLKKSFFGTF